MSLIWTQPWRQIILDNTLKKDWQGGDKSQLCNTLTLRVKVGTLNSKAPICGVNCESNCESKWWVSQKQIHMNRICVMPHLVPPKSMIRSPTMQQHCRLRGQGPFPFGSTFVQEAFSARWQQRRWGQDRNIQRKEDKWRQGICTSDLLWQTYYIR